MLYLFFMGSENPSLDIIVLNVHNLPFGSTPTFFSLLGSDSTAHIRLLAPSVLFLHQYWKPLCHLQLLVTSLSLGPLQRLYSFPGCSGHSVPLRHSLTTLCLIFEYCAHFFMSSSNFRLPEGRRQSMDLTQGHQLSACPTSHSTTEEVWSQGSQLLHLPSQFMHCTKTKTSDNQFIK